MSSTVSRAAIEALYQTSDDFDSPAPPADARMNGTARPLDTVRPSEPLVFLEPAEWAGEPVPEQQWLVHNRIPRPAVTILSGDGGTGKSLIALQLASANIRGADWLGAIVEEPGPAIFYTAEEPNDVLHRRLSQITQRQGIGFRDLAGLSIVSRADMDAALGAADRAGKVHATPLFDDFEKRAQVIQPSLIVIENAADVFIVNENDRGQARQCVGLLRRLALKCNAAVLLIAHPSLSGLQTGTGRSGSTAWSNSARSRLYLTAPTRGEDSDPDSDVRQLEVKKTNYGPPGECVRLRWENGIFVLASGAASPQQIAAEHAIERAYLDCLDAATAQGLHVFPHKGRGFAPKIFEAMPQAAGNGCRALETAQARLLAARHIHVVAIGPPSRQVRKIERTPTLSEV